MGMGQGPGGMLGQAYSQPGTGQQGWQEGATGKLLTNPEATIGGIMQYIGQIFPGSKPMTNTPGQSGMAAQPNVPQIAPNDRLAFLRAFNLQG